MKVPWGLKLEAISEALSAETDNPGGPLMTTSKTVAARWYKRTIGAYLERLSFAAARVLVAPPDLWPNKALGGGRGAYRGQGRRRRKTCRVEEDCLAILRGSSARKSANKPEPAPCLLLHATCRSTKMEALAEAHLALPVAQKNLLKYELMVPTDRLDRQTVARGFGDNRVREHFAEFLRDKEVAKSISGAQEFAGASLFSADALTKIDGRSKAESAADLCTYMIVFNSLSGESDQRLRETINKRGGRFAELPIMKQNLVEHTPWTTNTGLAQDVLALGIPTVQPLAVVKVQARSEESMIEALTDCGLKKFYPDIAESDKPAFPSPRFAVDVITKLDRD
ncbi:hypothetical protein DFH06DRAFT_1135824 [Mycena polygramma]|nr:hypothetical protein DFH06DRAFT_1135824 [Mycena polygramma]